ncbi:MAG TPA: DJ-1/PfpI family protein [Aliidongia sp.]|uniref:DJ-1/PfpI family protein n=1 Tax=Aliidongia sp. TaxID=1914230 RepID=UPI002DDCD4FE|nr:DJ-1/PfpI family protein [Aliidongia sp.]HEV2675741.1 DJ-1/PfpI family protein [Aliidongia sp.]
MDIAILTFDGFNELDSFVAAHILNRLRGRGWRARIVSPSAEVTSMNGVRVHADEPLEFARTADAVIVGSGTKTREIVADGALLARLALDPGRQLIGAQCSGALVLAKLGLLGGLPACTDLATKPWVVEAGVEVLDQPFFASGNIATAGGCLASQYLATWIMLRLGDAEAAEQVLRYVAPVGEKDLYWRRALDAVTPYLVQRAA